MLLRAMRRPSTIRALKLDRLRLSMGMRMGTMGALRLGGADGARRELLDGLAARAEGGEGRAGERVEEVVLAEHGGGLLFRGPGLLEPPKERARVRWRAGARARAAEEVEGAPRARWGTQHLRLPTRGVDLGCSWKRWRAMMTGRGALAGEARAI